MLLIDLKIVIFKSLIWFVFIDCPAFRLDYEERNQKKEAKEMAAYEAFMKAKEAD